MVTTGQLLGGFAGQTLFGVYDPNGDFSEDPSIYIEHIFLPWEGVLFSSIDVADDYAVERDRALLVTIEPWSWLRKVQVSPGELREGILAGKYDEHMRSICKVLSGLQSDVTVRWGHEMDAATSAFVWAGWKPKDFIQAFRRMIDVCRDSAPNVSVMWSPLGLENMADYYPGDEYADVIGLSVFGYQEWQVGVYGYAKSFVETFSRRYAIAARFDKPIMIAELGFFGDAAYVDLWKTELLQVSEAFPRVSGIVYFNQREVYPWPRGGGLPNWRLGENVVGE
jgi:endoglucanase